MVYAIECCHADDDDSDDNDVDSKYDDDGDDDDSYDDVDMIMMTIILLNVMISLMEEHECITFISAEQSSHQCKGAYWSDISPLTWRVVLVQYRCWKLLYHDEYAVLLQTEEEDDSYDDDG